METEKNFAHCAETEDVAGTSLAIVSKKAVSLISSGDAEDILGSLRLEIEAFKPDMSTHEGREKIRSFAYSIARKKTKLIAIGDQLAEDAKKQVKAIGEEKKIIENRMNDLRDKVREPLTKWENAEKERVEAQQLAVDRIKAIGETAISNWLDADLSALNKELTAFEAHKWDMDFGERGPGTLADAKEKLRSAEKKLQDHLAEQAELAKLRAEQERRRLEDEAREKAEREKRIAEEAAEAERARAEKEAAIKAAEQAAALEQARRAQENAERMAQEAEQRRLDQERRAEDDRRAAEQEAIRREQIAKDAAIAAEQQRALDALAAKQKEKNEREKAEAFKEHRRQINAKAVSAISLSIVNNKDGNAETIARTIVEAIIRGYIPNVTIGY